MADQFQIVISGSGRKSAISSEVSVFCTICVFIPYVYSTYHTHIRIWYDHTHMVRITVPYVYGAYETTGVYIYSSLRS